MCGGVALYLLGHAAFQLRLLGSFGFQKVVAAGALLIIYLAGADLAAWGVEGLVALTVIALCVVETVRGDSS